MADASVEMINDCTATPAPKVQAQGNREPTAGFSIHQTTPPDLRAIATTTASARGRASYNSTPLRDALVLASPVGGAPPPRFTRRRNLHGIGPGTQRA